MATITPRIELTSNPSGGPTPTGPISIGLSLNKSLATTVGTDVKSGVAEVTTLHTDNKIFDATSPKPSYIYINNTSDTTIYAGSSGVAGTRFLQLLTGEFGWLPWAGQQDIFLYHAGVGNKNCEYWIFEI
mgnify:CR=1 FL=1|tara:strand:+ start:2465 stop:2854 length:390 start_codon:yes stop_codon:yes gene_type:complete